VTLQAVLTDGLDIARANALTSSALQLIIMPTEKCNFRCTYCYEEFIQGKMSQQTVSGIKSLIARRAQSISELRLDWFGGEPTLAIEIIEEINGFAQTKILNGQTFFSSISTNGWLLNSANFGRLCDVNVHDYQISLDGESTTHDRTRILANGRGSYETIMRNMEDAAKTKRDFRINFRIHLYRYNIDSVHSLIERLARTFEHDSRFYCYVKAVENLGKDAKKIGLLDDKHIVDDLNERIKSAGMLSRGVGEVHPCYAAKANSLVIRSDGRVGKCTVALRDSRNTVGYLSENGTVQVDRERFLLWIRGALNGDPASLMCPLMGLPPIPAAQC
jgi:uncharacterized protein